MLNLKYLVKTDYKVKLQRINYKVITKVRKQVIAVKPAKEIK